MLPLKAIKSLVPTVVHTWRLKFADLMTYYAQCFVVLSDNEKQRAQAYHIEADRNCYVLTHGILRYLLATYTNVTPQALCFTQQAHGKPILVREQGGQPIEFNLSHTREYAVIAIGLSPVGVDIEYIREDIKALRLASRFFSQAEYQALSALPTHEQASAFIYAWTIKEAWVKASGQGIANTFPHFDVSVDTHQKPHVIQANERHIYNCWSINIAAHYYGTLVTSADVTKILEHNVASELFM